MAQSQPGQGIRADDPSCRSTYSSSSPPLSTSQVAAFMHNIVAICQARDGGRDSDSGSCCILPGDCILAINGTAVAGNFTTLSQATSVLQSQTQLLLIVLRLHHDHDHNQKQQPQQQSAGSSLLLGGGHHHSGQQQQQQQHLLDQQTATAAAAPSPTSTLRFPMPHQQQRQQQQHQQQQQQSAESSSIFKTARKAWHALRLVNNHHHDVNIVASPSTPPPPSPPPPSLSTVSSSSSSSTTTSAADDSWNAADALLCLLRGNNNNNSAAISSSPTAPTVTLPQPPPQNHHGSHGATMMMAFSTPPPPPLHYPSMSTTSPPPPLPFWSPPPPPPPRSTMPANSLSLDFFSSCPPPYFVRNDIYSSYAAVSSRSPPPPPPPPPQALQHHQHWPLERRDYPRRPVLHYNQLFRDHGNNKQVPPAAQYYFNSVGRPHGGAQCQLLLPYDDDWEEEDPDEGRRARLFLKHIDNSTPETFGRWLQHRKGAWHRQQQRRYSTVHKSTRPPPRPPVAALVDLRTCSTADAEHKGGGFALYRNPLFCEKDPKYDSSTTQESKTTTSVATAAFFGPTSGLPYDDDLEFEPDDGQRAKLFLNPIDMSCPNSFAGWLKQRKRKWRHSCYKVYPILETNSLVVDDDDKSSSPTLKSSLLSIEEDDLASALREELSVAVDFWSSQGYSSFQHWLSTSKSRWKSSYSWNQRKRQRIQEDFDQVVRLASPLHHHRHHHHHAGDDYGERNTTTNQNDNFAQWLRVRKNQWRVLRRKRQRERIMNHSNHQRDQYEHILFPAPQQHVGSDSTMKKNTTTWDNSSPTPRKDLWQQRHQPSFQSDELIAIDALLEDQERERLAKETQKPLDVSFLFDSALNCPDDVVVHCLQYLDPMEHCKLLCLNRETRQALSKREDVWRQLCPTTWQLPRRPRKPWHILYSTKLRTETQRARKRCDDVLVRAASILLKGDQLQSIEKLCAKAEQDVAMPFDVNYSSGVVCERNSLLNLAVIHQRQKVVRWLVETMKADIETYDRGGFTPLLNAAWAGDKYLVRYFLSAGANRAHIGTCHYTKPLAAPDFAGLNAAGWARKQGHDGIAKLIELGL